MESIRKKKNDILHGFCGKEYEEKKSVIWNYDFQIILEEGTEKKLITPCEKIKGHIIWTTIGLM